MRTLLPHGLDDLEHGVEYLLGDCPPWDRERVAVKIASDLASTGDAATLAFIVAVQRFAQFSGDGATVREAFHRFAVDNGPAIGGLQQASAAARRSANARTPVNVARQARQIAWLAQALKRLRPRARSTDNAATLIADRIANDPAFAGIECPKDMPSGRSRLIELIKRVPNLGELLR